MATPSTPGQLINVLMPGAFVALGKVGVNDGSVEARKLRAGAVHLYWRYTLDGKTCRVPIGVYDSGAPPKSTEPTTKGYSVRAAFRAAEVFAKQHRDHIDEGGFLVVQERRRVERERAAAERIAEGEQTLKRLLTLYCDYLEGIGRRSHKDARSIFKLHVFEAWPKIAAQPAKHVTPEQFADMMRKLIEAEKGRTANKLRSYARAAYQVAKAAKSKPSIPVAFKDFGVTTNPVADTAPDESQNRPDKRPMSAGDLRAYWRNIRDLPGIKGAVLRLHMLTGGQRIEQLVNLRTVDVLDDHIVLFDGKGRPGAQPRPHSVPLVKEAAKALKECNPRGVYAISTDGGETHLSASTLSAWAMEAIGDAVEEFQAKRVRSGVETLLAGAGVTQELRGRLQSHGVSGVQARHYDGYEYMPEKRKALETLFRLVERKDASKDASTVVPMPKKAA